jgi:enoyl-CoA hydratase/carnithine racemase
MCGVRHDTIAGVARLTLIAAAQQNPLNASTLTALASAVQHAEDDTSIRAIVIDAEGEHFCSGMDLSAGLDSELDAGMESLRLFADTLLRIRRTRLPVIACIEGKAAGGGVGLAAACDIVLASTTASFILPEVIVGMVPALITPFLLRRVTAGRLGHLALSSRTLPALEARELGIVDEVADDVRAALGRQLSRIGRSAPEAIAESKRCIDRMDGRNLEQQMEAACTIQFERLQRADVREGVQQFADGFSPRWFSRIGGSLTDPSATFIDRGKGRPETR